MKVFRIGYDSRCCAVILFNRDGWRGYRCYITKMMAGDMEEN